MQQKKPRQRVSSSDSGCDTEKGTPAALGPRRGEEVAEGFHHIGRGVLARPLRQILPDGNSDRQKNCSDENGNPSTK
jgi:hypothetical protein